MLALRNLLSAKSLCGYSRCFSSTDLSKNIVNSLEQFSMKSQNRSVKALLDAYREDIQKDNAQCYDLPTNRVFTNNYTNFDDIEVVGFDLDYTLVTYSEKLQKLIYDLARDVLLTNYGYPTQLKQTTFDPDFAIRGLCVDVQHGTLCKLSYQQRVGNSYVYKGRKALAVHEIEELYGDGRHISYDDFLRMRPLNDMFSMAEACLIADTIHIVEEQGEGFAYSPTNVVDDVQAAIGEVHIHGSMHEEVLKNPDLYINPIPELSRLLQHLRSSGKQLFLCTNSGYNYADQAMKYVLGLSDTEEHSLQWRQFFDVVICSSNKPNFYTGRKPFRVWNTRMNTPTCSLPPQDGLMPGEVYAGGSVFALKRAMGWHGRRVLYVGDNLFADLVQARKLHGWQTACVIQELDHEMQIQYSPDFQALQQLRSTTRRLLRELQEVERVEYRAMLRTQDDVNELSLSLASDDSTVLAGTTGDTHTDTQTLATVNNSFCHVYSGHGEYRKLYSSIEISLQCINKAMSTSFNQYFGSTFRTDGSPSMYAFSIRRYVDLYMSSVCNLMLYSPFHRFFPTHGVHMAHDPHSDNSNSDTERPDTHFTHDSSDHSTSDHRTSDGRDIPV